MPEDENDEARKEGREEASGKEGAAPAKPTKPTKTVRARRSSAKGDDEARPAEEPEEQPAEVAAEPFDSARDEGPTVDMPPPGKQGAAAAGGAAAGSSGLATLCHLLGLADLTLSILLIGFLAPLVLWLVMKDKDPEVDYHGKESINFQLNVLFWSLVGWILVPCFGLGLFLIPALSVAEIVLIILAAVAAANGQRYRYPAIYRMLV